MNFGHSHPKITAAIKKQLDKATHSGFLDFYSELPVRFAENLVSFLPYPLKRVFLSNSGTESIEAAMKLARYHTRRKYFMSFFSSFHGRTYGSLSLTMAKKIHKEGFGPFLDVIHVPYANPYRCYFENDHEDCTDEIIGHIEDVVFKKEVDPDNVAAIFSEPIQGEGGYVIPPKRFLPAIKKLCEKYGILYCDDEVQAGNFRTGKFLASENFGVKPDVVSMSKALDGGIPLGATISSDKIMDWPRASHANTWGGNFIACSAGLAALDLMKDKNLGKNVVKKGNYILKRLEEWEGKYEIIGHVRGIGLMIGIEFVKNKDTKEPAVKERDKILWNSFKNGLALLGAGESVIRIAPPLIIGYEDIDTSLEILEKSIKSVL